MASCPSISVSFDRISRCCQLLTSRRVADAVPLSGGLTNGTFRIDFEGLAEPVVLRIYQRDSGACRKELELLSTLARMVSVPQVLHAEPQGLGDVGPFIFLRYVEGITFRELKAMGDKRAMQEASYSVGTALAAIGNQDLKSLRHTTDERNTIRVEDYLRSPLLTDRIGCGLAEQIGDLFASSASQVQLLQKERRLVHGDFRKQNILLSNQA